MPRRVNNKRKLKRARRNRAADRRDTRKSIPASVQMTRGISRGPRKFLSQHDKRKAAKKNKPTRSTPNGSIRNPKTELEAATQRFVDLYDFAPIAYVSFGRTGRIEEANLTATELLGEPRDRLIGRPFAFYVADLDLFMRHLLYCRTSQRQVKTELQLKTRKGERIPALLCSRPITSTTRNGALLYQTAIIDLSERKRAEQALQESSQRLQATYERAPIGIIESSPEGKYVGANEEFCRILGYRKEELLQRDIEDVTHKEDYSRDIKLHRQLVAGEIPFYEIETRFVRKDGAVIWAQVLRSIVRDAEGTPLYAIGAVRDITEHKAAEEKLTWLAAFRAIIQTRVEELVWKSLPFTMRILPALNCSPIFKAFKFRLPFFAKVLKFAKPLLEGRT